MEFGSINPRELVKIGRHVALAGRIIIGYGESVFAMVSGELGVSLDRVESTENGSGYEREAEGPADWHPPRTKVVEPVWVWGVPFAPFSMSQAVAAIEKLVDEGQPSFFITANVHYAMLTDQNSDVRAINQRASFILADGAPLVWASRWQGSPLPERVAGSDLIFELSASRGEAGISCVPVGGC